MALAGRDAQARLRRRRRPAHTRTPAGSGAAAAALRRGGREETCEGAPPVPRSASCQCHGHASVRRDSLGDNRDGSSSGTPLVVELPHAVGAAPDATAAAQAPDAGPCGQRRGQQRRQRARRRGARRTVPHIWTSRAIPGAGGVLLCEALGDSVALKRVRLGSTLLGEEGAHAAAAALERTHSLREMDLSDNGIGASGAAALGHALLAGKRCCQKLELARNPLGRGGGRAVLRTVVAAAKEGYMVRIGADDCRLTDEHNLGATVFTVASAAAKLSKAAAGSGAGSDKAARQQRRASLKARRASIARPQALVAAAVAQAPDEGEEPDPAWPSGTYRLWLNLAGDRGAVRELLQRQAELPAGVLHLGALQYDSTPISVSDLAHMLRNEHGRSAPQQQGSRQQQLGAYQTPRTCRRSNCRRARAACCTSNVLRAAPAMAEARARVEPKGGATGAGEGDDDHWDLDAAAAAVDLDDVLGVSLEQHVIDSVAVYVRYAQHEGASAGGRAALSAEAEGVVSDGAALAFVRLFAADAYLQCSCLHKLTSIFSGDLPRLRRKVGGAVARAPAPSRSPNQWRVCALSLLVPRLADVESIPRFLPPEQLLTATLPRGDR